MDIRADINDRTQVNFKSINHPVKAFSICTGRDVIKFKEWNYKQVPRKRQLRKVASFFLDNFASQSSHPFWPACRKGQPTFVKYIYNNYVTDLIKEYKKLLKNPDTTLMLGRNNKNQLSAAILAEPLELSHIVKDKNTLYIDSIAVNKKYRGHHIGNTLMNNVIKSTKNRYSDVFLVSYKESEEFYKKQGFTNLTTRHKGQKKLINSLSEVRSDYPDYASFLTKPIDSKKQRWYDKFSKWYVFW